MFPKSNIISLIFTIFIISAIFSCSSSTGPKTDNNNPSAPVPGAALTAAGTGATISITWGEASDDSGTDELIYKLVRSKSPIEDVGKADLLSNVIQNYSEYSAGHVYDFGVPAGTHYYNVIVKDSEGNKALYTGDSAKAVLDDTPPVPGSSLVANAYFSTITVTW